MGARGFLLLVIGLVLLMQQAVVAYSILFARHSEATSLPIAMLIGGSSFVALIAARFYFYLPNRKH